MADARQPEGWITFAAIVAAIAGMANSLIGTGAVFNSQAFPQNGILYASMMSWGWTMVVFGVLQIIAAWLLVARSNPGRILAIVLASVSIVAWTLWLGAYPFAAVAALVLDILVIYGLSVTGEYFAKSSARQTSAQATSGGQPAGSH